MEVCYSKILHRNYRRYQQIELSGFHGHMPVVLYILWGLKDQINNCNRGLGYSREIQGISIKYMLMHLFGNKRCIWTVGTEVYLSFSHVELCLSFRHYSVMFCDITHGILRTVFHQSLHAQRESVVPETNAGNTEHELGGGGNATRETRPLQKCQLYCPP